jgi:SAM-dependent methyltransferase
LSRHCEKVVAIDHSSIFISSAKKIQEVGSLEYVIWEEGGDKSLRTAYLPKGVNADRVTFLSCDVMEFVSISEAFDVVIAANLLCRVNKPKDFLSALHQLVLPGGQLILTSPYSWLEEYSPRSYWLRNLESLREILDEDFVLHRFFDLPFLIREHFRKYQFGITQATIWKRKDV